MKHKEQVPNALVTTQGLSRGHRKRIRHQKHRRRSRRHFHVSNTPGRKMRHGLGKSVSGKSWFDHSSSLNDEKLGRVFNEVDAQGQNDEPEDPRMEREILQIFASEQNAEDPFSEPSRREREDSYPEWDDDSMNDMLLDHEIFSDASDREIFSDGSEGEAFPDDNYNYVETEVEHTTEATTKDYKCSFSGTSGDVITLDQHGRSDDLDNDDEASGNYPDDTEGSGLLEESDSSKDMFSNTHFELVNTNTSSARLALISGGDDDNGNDAKKERTTTTTVILPFVIPEGATMSSNLHMTVTGDGKLIDWDYMVRTEKSAVNTCSLLWHLSMLSVCVG